MTRRCEHASELILTAMACLSPWAFGSVEEWAQLGLALGVVLLALLWASGGRPLERRAAVCCLPSLALGALVALALLQAAPLPEALLGALSPAAARLRTGLIPQTTANSSAAIPDRAVALPAATLSQDPEGTRHAAAGLAAAWIVLQSVLALRFRPDVLRRFSIALAINAAALALYSLVQALVWNGKIYGWRSSPYTSAGPFVSHNHLAAYLNLGLGLALGFLLAPGEGARGRKLWPAYAATLIVAGIVVSLSRSGFLAMAGAGLGLGVALWRRPRGGRLWLSVGMLALLIPIFLMVLSQSVPFQRRLATLLTSASYGQRIQIWRDAIRAWPDVAIWGTGLGSFAAAAAPYFRHATGVKYTHAENEYVEWLVEGGLIGLGLGIAFVYGVVRLGQRAWHASSSGQRRALMLGAAFSGLSLVIQCGGDFAPHIPAVGLTAIILAGLVVGPGLGVATALVTHLGPERRTMAAGWRLAEVAIVGAGLLVVCHGVARARAEAAFLGAGVGLRDNGLLVRIEDRQSARADTPTDEAAPDLERMRRALEQALRLRPDWAEGHLRLGLVRLHDYERTAAEAIAADVDDPASRFLLASPLWLHQVIHSSGAGAGSRAAIGELVDHAPIRDHLVPAARSFLEARRCCPVLALPHAELATLDYLLIGGDPGTVYAARALRLAGSNGTLIALATQLAVQEEAPDLAARGLRKALQTGALNWTEVADLAGGVLTPAQILQDVVPDSRTALAFSDRLYTAPAEQPIRRGFLQAALRRLPEDGALAAAERLELEAQLWQRLEDRTRARAQMEAALDLEPRRVLWRQDLVSWLIAWGRPREAHDQALAGLQYAPERPEMQAALDRSAEAMARGPGVGRLVEQGNPK